MRIALDYTPAIAQSAGIGRYTRELVAALIRIDSADRFTLFSAERPSAGRSLPTAPNVRARVVPIGNRNLTILWQRMRAPIPAELLMGSADVLHGPDFILPPVARMPSVVTVHDLAFLTHPDCAVPSLSRYLSIVVPRAVRVAERVIAVSRRTADDLTALLGVAPEKLTVIPNGIAPRFSGTRDEEAVARLRATYRIEAPAVLAVGTIEPRKNYARLLAAFATARREPGGPRTLVIAGRKGWLYDDVFEAVERYHVSDGVRFLDYVADEDLPSLYHTADLLAIPSRYEGFGIPAAEAMASGVPVIYGDAGALPEVVGDAGLAVPPEDVAALAEALVRGIQDAALREQMIARGRERAAGLTWEAAAQAHLQVYRAAAGAA